MSEPQRHSSLVLDQFTRQAAPFAKAMAPTIDEFLDVLVAHTALGPDDAVLDVACGPGVLSCAMARVAKHVTGTDIVPAMLEQAQIRQRNLGLSNVQWQLGNAEALPYEPGAFSLVTTRYSFHHLLQPRMVLRQMARVCRAGGCLAVADATPERDKAAAFNAYESIRDPSHVQALSVEDLLRLADGLPLELMSRTKCDQDIALDTVLGLFSFPTDGDIAALRRRVESDIGTDRLSLGAYRRDDEVRIRFPTSLVVWRRK